MESAIVSATAGRGILARHDVALDRGIILGLTVEPRVINQLDQIGRRMFNSESIPLKPSQ